MNLRDIAAAQQRAKELETQPITQPAKPEMSPARPTSLVDLTKNPVDRKAALAARVEELATKAKSGIEALKDWYETGEGADRIRWGTEGDLTRCAEIAGRHISDPFGFCQRRHMAIFGESNATRDARQKKKD